MPNDRTPTDNDDPRLAGFSQPRRYVEDKDEPEAETEVVDKQPDNPEADPDTAPTTDGERTDEQLSTEAILRREVWQREMHKIGERRRELDAKAQELAELEEMRDFLKENPALTQEIVEKYNQQRQPGSSEVPENQGALLARITRLEQSVRQRDEALTNDAYAARLELEAQRVAQEFGFDVPAMQGVVSKAIKEDLIGFGQDPGRIYSRLRMAASEAKLPTAKADGQRELLSQVNQKRRASSPMSERPQAPEAEPDVTKMSKEQYQKLLISIAEKASAAT